MVEVAYEPCGFVQGLRAWGPSDHDYEVGLAVALSEEYSARLDALFGYGRHRRVNVSKCLRS
jgi:hypothetical protein